MTQEMKPEEDVFKRAQTLYDRDVAAGTPHGIPPVDAQALVYAWERGTKKISAGITGCLAVPVNPETPSK